MERINNRDLIRTEAYVGGAWISSEDTFAVTDPATDAVLAQVPNLGREQTEQAIAAANNAWPQWRAKTGKERAATLRRWFDLIVANTDDLAALMTYEQGKPLAESKGEVAYGASFIEWFAEEAKRVTGDVPAPVAADTRIVVMKQAVGVCAAITPWNFPIAMITRKAAPALAAGCTVVLKPAEQTPLSALALAELAEQAGFPPGVFNVVTGDAEQSVEIGKALCESDIVRHLSFTGSTQVGRILMQQCAPTIKKLALELGGNSPFVVFADADIDAAVDGAIASKYRNTGQTCVCTNRFYAHEDIYEQFVEKLVTKVATFAQGNGFEEGVTQGPLIDDAGLAKVQEHVADAISKGATIRLGGQAGDGRFYAPTVITNASADMQLAREETFGPVAAVFSFTSDAQVIDVCNDTEFGLASYFYTSDIARAWKVAEALEYGIVGINTGLISNEVGPFGGVKQSGLGREGSQHGIDEYIEMKYCLFGGIKAQDLFGGIKAQDF